MFNNNLLFNLKIIRVKYNGLNFKSTCCVEYLSYCLPKKAHQLLSLEVTEYGMNRIQPMVHLSSSKYKILKQNKSKDVAGSFNKNASFLMNSAIQFYTLKNLSHIWRKNIHYFLVINLNTSYNSLYIYVTEPVSARVIFFFLKIFHWTRNFQICKLLTGTLYIFA